MKKIIFFLILFFPFPAMSEQSSITFGDWELTATDDTLDIKTTNSSDSIFVMVCARGIDCFFSLVSDTRCDKGGKYSALLNTDASAHPVTLECNPFVYHGKQKYGLMLKNDVAGKPATMMNLISKTKNIGFAIALESGLFKSIRFSSDGFINALSVMMKVIDESKNQNIDETL